MSQRNHRLFEEFEGAVGDRIALTVANARIVRSVLRLSKGDRISLLNGRGRVATVELLEVGKTRTTVAVLEKKDVLPPWPEITLLQGLPKGEKSSWIVQKGVEFGARRIIFFESAHTIGKKSSGQQARWMRVAVEALRQSGNAHLPSVLGPLPLPEALRQIETGRRLVFLDESEKTRRLRDAFGSETPAAICVGVGPEGGWSEEDRIELQRKGFEPVRIGPFTLRTETAAIAALAALRAWFP